MKIMIYGAKSLALGACKALQRLYPAYPVKGFLVSSLENNPPVLAELPVLEVRDFSRRLSQEEKKDVCILVGTPEDIHPEIVKNIEENGFNNYVCLDSRREARLMERYFAELGIFPSLHSLPGGGLDSGESFGKSSLMLKLQIFMIKSYKDRPLKQIPQFPEWVLPIQVGAALTDIKAAEIADNTGQNISRKNGNYCEMTAFYWLWKNRLMDLEDSVEYYGFSHYRRMMDISKDDLGKIAEHDVDAVLFFPTLHEPDIREHHGRYVKEEDWEAMLQALHELQPDYWKAYPEIFSGPYFYNYNMIIARKQVLADYCEWLFPILERTEELSTPKGWERADRYTAYMSESLMTLYFLYNERKLRIYHTGRIMLV